MFQAKDSDEVHPHGCPSSQRSELRELTIPITIDAAFGGWETTGDGIKVVDVAGTSAAGAFVLGAPAIIGAYGYDLFQNGIADPDDGDWYLRAASLAPTVPVYENYPIVLLGLALDYDAGAGAGRSHVYSTANLTYEFVEGTAADVADVNVAFEPNSFGAELGVGGTYRWADGKYALYGEALASSSFDGSYGFKGTIGLSTTF